MKDELFHRVSKTELLKELASRGLSNTEIGDALNKVEDIISLTDGKKPVYVIEVAPGFTHDAAMYLSAEFIACNLTAIIIPANSLHVFGAVTGDSWNKSPKGIDSG